MTRMAKSGGAAHSSDDKDIATCNLRQRAPAEEHPGKYRKPSVSRHMKAGIRSGVAGTATRMCHAVHLCIARSATRQADTV